MGGHRIEVDAAIDYPDGSRRVMFSCTADDCVDGHVEASPAAVADLLVSRLAAEHDGTGVLLGGLVEVGAE